MQHRKEGQPTWTETKVKVVNNRLMYATANGFVLGAAGLRTILGQIAADISSSYTKLIPSLDAVRTHLALRRDVPHRSGENKYITRLKKGKL